MDAQKHRTHAWTLTDSGRYRTQTEDTNKCGMVAAKHNLGGRMATAYACGRFAAWIRLQLRLLDFLGKSSQMK